MLHQNDGTYKVVTFLEQNYLRSFVAYSSRDSYPLKIGEFFLFRIIMMFLIHEKLLCLSTFNCVRHGLTRVLECQIPAPAVPYSCA